MTTINPYIGFNGKCREAMTFYQHCFGGGELSFTAYEDTPMGAQCAPQMKHHIAHSSLAKGSLTLMGTDMTGPDGYIHGNSIAISVSCASEEEINNLFNRLSEDGKIMDALGIKFWGDMFGAVTDKYGVSWMLNYHKSEQD